MRVSRIVPFIIVTIACSGAAYMASTGGGHVVAPPVAPAGVHHHPHPDEGHDTAVHDAVAAHDVSAHAALHYPDAAIDATTLVSDYSWTPEWELRFVVANHHGEIVQFAHATHRHHREHRFVSRWDAEHSSWSAWELAP